MNKKISKSYTNTATMKNHNWMYLTRNAKKLPMTFAPLVEEQNDTQYKVRF